jgi:ectoine hydroxylase-related dioxygenase (phytanoyl-CoA dioxygenase family)
MEVNFSLDQLNSKDFWLEMADGEFNISKENIEEEINEEKISDFKDELFNTEAYLHLENKVSYDFEKINKFLKKLYENNLPCVFAFVFDEFWAMHNQLAPYVKHFLDKDSRLLATPWIWYVDAKKEKEILDSSKGETNQELKTRSMFSGFYGPHRDKGKKALFEDGSPKILSFWMPLSKATPINSCIYLVPADRDPTYGTDDDHCWDFKRADIRALPANPGDVLFWNEAILHWGSRPALRDDVEPRISIGFEYIKSDFLKTCYPNYEFGFYPDFETRLAVIATQFKLYLTEEGFPPLFIEFIKANSSIIRNSDEKL